MEPRIKRLAVRLNWTHPVPFDNSLGLTVEHHQALNPAEHPQGGRQRLPRAIEPIEDTEEVGENLRRGVLLVEVTIELNATLEVGEVGLGALPAVEVLGSTGLGLTNLRTCLLKLPFEFAVTAFSRRYPFLKPAAGVMRYVRDRWEGDVT